MILAALLLAFAQPAPPEPGLLDNGWFYGEIGNGCMAARGLPDGSRLIMRLTKWDDLSDSLILWRPNLPPLATEGEYTTGRSEAEEQADAEAGHGLSAAIDGNAVEPAMDNYQMLDFQGKAGISYRIGILQSHFLAALAGGRTLEILRHGRPIAAFPVDGSADLARRMRECVAKSPSF